MWLYFTTILHMQLLFQAGNQRNSPSGGTLNSTQVRVGQSGVHFHPFDSLAIGSSGGGEEERQYFFINSSHARLERWPVDLQLLRATRVTANEVREAVCRHSMFCCGSPAAAGSLKFKPRQLQGVMQYIGI